MADGISTRNVWPHYDAANVQAASGKKDNNTLGKDDFLKILVTQLRNQDPMEPLKDREFIAQMAEFTSVEQLMNMSEQLTMLRQSLGSASSLIGKTVEWNEMNESGAIEPQSGTVDSIVLRDGIQYAKVKDKEVALEYLLSISAGESSESAETDAAEGGTTP
ncbi:flagellar hook capping FlgD N-terminal domain-containing protein [Paenibacillus sp. GCM10023252]|uniref:flagellar hook capping FlgD N-terminal domain-containing protein n=1 Tax=Paenibacillus sp. GCM10023252 TaxID=3252649 RepID=UPI003612114E